MTKKAKRAALLVSGAMFSLAIAVLACAAIFEALQTIAHAAEPESKWKLVGKYKMSKDDTLQVICDVERGNLVYLTPIHFRDMNLGNIPYVIHQPDACSKSTPEMK